MTVQTAHRHKEGVTFFIVLCQNQKKPLSRRVGISKYIQLAACCSPEGGVGVGPSSIAQKFSTTKNGLTP